AADGSLVEAGVLEDPRWFFWDNVGPDGRFHGGYMQGPSGLLGLNLPAVAGSIRVFEMDGAEIGRTDFEPICWTEDAPACRGR
ncbi:MAG: hypothetical protein RBT51_01535, partial [Ectothiorhodospiraceae bacterium]|nr:hypothetical protein [Ectothiorhodospiraceae bacterium]